MEGTPVKTNVTLDKPESETPTHTDETTTPVRRRGLWRIACLVVTAVLAAGGLTIAPTAQAPAAAVDTAKILYVGSCTLYVTHNLDGTNRTVKRVTLYTDSLSGSAEVRVPNRTFPINLYNQPNSVNGLTVNSPAVKGNKVTANVKCGSQTKSVTWTL